MTSILSKQEPGRFLSFQVRRNSPQISMIDFQDDTAKIVWRLHLAAPVSRVYQALSTDAGRASFWAESAVEHDGVIHFVFPNGVEWQGRD